MVRRMQRRMMRRIPLVFVGLVMACPPARAELRRPPVKTWFVEGWAGPLFTVTELESKPNRNVGLPPVEWSARLQFGVAAGARVTDVANLDVGLRFGLGFQSRYQVDRSDFSYNDAIKLIELVPYARGAVFPFPTDAWGISFEGGAGLRIATGGKQGAVAVPADSQLAIRLRFALGATWRFTTTTALTLDFLSVVVDLAATSEWQDTAGHLVAIEPRLGFQYRF